MSSLVHLKRQKWVYYPTKLPCRSSAAEFWNEVDRLLSEMFPNVPLDDLRKLCDAGVFPKRVFLHLLFAEADRRPTVTSAAVGYKRGNPHQPAVAGWGLGLDDLDE